MDQIKLDYFFWTKLNSIYFLILFKADYLFKITKNL
jgi:hypothetical protein